MDINILIVPHFEAFLMDVIYENEIGFHVPVRLMPSECF